MQQAGCLRPVRRAFAFEVGQQGQTSGAGRGGQREFGHAVEVEAKQRGRRDEDPGRVERADQRQEAPGRVSFTSALEAAREELTAARGICPDGPVDLPGVIGRAVLSTLLPARRPRFSARKVKCATSRYLNRDDGRPHTMTAVTAIDITVRTPPLSAGRPRRYTPARPRPPQPPTRRQLITAIITSQRGTPGHPDR